MARLKIELPASFAFATELDVRITDINYGRHLGNDALLGLLHEARLRFLASMGFSELDAGGAALIMADVAIAFRSQAFHGDRLRVEVAVAEPGRLGFDLVYRMTDASTGREVARAKTGMAFFDYEAGKPVRMPEAFAVSTT